MGNPERETADQIRNWLDTRIDLAHHKATQARTFALGLKAAQIVLAGAIPILALANPAASRPTVNGILGALIVIIEGFQHSFKFEQFWIKYRRDGCEWEGEKLLYLMRGGPYEKVEDRDALLATRVAVLMEKQAGAWADNVLKTLVRSN